MLLSRSFFGMIAICVAATVATPVAEPAPKTTADPGNLNDPCESLTVSSPKSLQDICKSLAANSGNNTGRGLQTRKSERAILPNVVVDVQRRDSVDDESEVDDDSLEVTPTTPALDDVDGESDVETDDISED